MTALEKLKLNRMYRALLDKIQLRNYIEGGLCIEIDKLFKNKTVLHDDYILLREHFNDNKPSLKRHTLFYLNPAYKNEIFWWELSDKGYKQRIKFLKKLIKLTK